MAANVAPPKNTGGGGFVFEDDVCAWLLACMLAGEPVFEPKLGAPIRIDFQTRVDGWFLDDVLLTTPAGAAGHRFALSVKSNAQLTASAAPEDFVRCAWEQWLHVGSSVFRGEQDFMGLITAPLSGTAASSVAALTEKVQVADPDLLPGRLATPHWASQDERALFASFHCPPSLDTGTLTAVDTARLLQRLRFLQCDFSAVTSASLKNALELCRRSVRSHSAEDAQDLWRLLRGIAARYRPRAGSLTLGSLVDELRCEIDLADHPEHSADWTTLDGRSRREAAATRDTLGGGIRLGRDADVSGLAAAVAANELVALLGPSGSGKSAIAKVLFERRASSNQRTLWVDARSLDSPDFGAFEAALRTRHSLAELLGRTSSAEPMLILDGLDRLYSDGAFRNAALLLKIARPPSASRSR